MSSASGGSVAPSGPNAPTTGGGVKAKVALFQTLRTQGQPQPHKRVQDTDKPAPKQPVAAR